ncbi:ABC transporter permease [Marispirochaeta aestuarii]|uniref:ABC transporter permease n=1 Tax=Marispirochaeta aestuarii TaxID=1963862 RepID=UPI002ABE5645|nr:ABC transporter permease [Marispirochaeta aestuarii]
MRKFLALLHARNMEFLRDRATLFWNLVFPLFLVFGFAFAFSDGTEYLFKAGVLGNAPEAEPFMQEEYVEFVPYDEADKAAEKLRHHQIDLLIDFDSGTYLVNKESPKGKAAEKLLLASSGPPLERREVSGKAIRYVDWLVPGIIGMNMMFSCIFGVGWVIVRYRKNGVLKRLKATPVRAIQFILAQLFSRLYIVLITATIVYAGSNLILDFIMLGSYLDLVLVTALATLCMISFGLIFASRLKSEELADGLMNLATWPMMVFSGVFFSMEGTPQVLQWIARAFPLTHYIEAARAIMLDGAGLVQVAPNLMILALLSALFLGISALSFKWE